MLTMSFSACQDITFKGYFVLTHPSDIKKRLTYSSEMNTSERTIRNADDHIDSYKLQLSDKVTICFQASFRQRLFQGSQNRIMLDYR